MAFWNNREKPEAWRTRQLGVSHSHMPPGPPSRSIHERKGETPESVRDTEDWHTYMAGFAHGVAFAHGVSTEQSNRDKD